MATLVLDIETVGIDLEALHDSARAYLLRAAQRESTEELRVAAEAKIRDQMSLWPLTARIVAIAMVNVESGGGRVYYDSPQPEAFTADDGRSRCVGNDESGCLGAFWKDVRHYDRVVTFNGRGFDLPFLMLRSAIHGLRPSRNLMTRKHVDLLDELTFRGATRRFNLDFYCQTFGIESPKAAGVRGSDVADLHRAGEYQKIAQYCLRDAVATAALYKRWRDTLCFDEPHTEETSSASDL